MKVILFINALLLICSCSQNKSKEIAFTKHPIPNLYTLKSSTDISIVNDTVWQNNKKYSGYLYEMYPNTLDTFSIQSYYDGLQNGIEKKWFPDNQLMEQRSFTMGKKNGTQIAFWENGNKKFEFVAKDDAYEGEMKEWNIEGKLIHLATYKEGQENGTQKLWYNNGKIRANYMIINGKRYGLLGTKNCKNVSDSIFTVK